MLVYILHTGWPVGCVILLLYIEIVFADDLHLAGLLLHTVLELSFQTLTHYTVSLPARSLAGSFCFIRVNQLLAA